MVLAVTVDQEIISKRNKDQEIIPGVKKHGNTKNERRNAHNEHE